jgi:NAD(P)H-dependent FMN reductase
VAKFVQSRLEQRGNKVTVIDPRQVDLRLLQKPHFAYAKSQIPDVLREIHEVFETADAYVAVTPEYNHAPSPALLNILNHFGSSTFGFKPSAIVSYSAGQWGGTRASHALRPVLSELGCIPVSAMIHVPFAQDAFNEDGTVQGGEDEQKRWEGYMDRCFSQVRVCLKRILSLVERLY